MRSAPHGSIPGRRANRLLAWLVAVVVAGSVIAGGGAASAGKRVLVGAGSTTAKLLIDQWRADVGRTGLRVTYQGTGSAAGRALFWQNNVDFAASETPFSKAELKFVNQARVTHQYLPEVATGLALAFNLRSRTGKPISKLRLTPSLIAGIFTGTLTEWNDHQISRRNPNVKLPHKSIRPVIRSDGDGSSAVLSEYLAETAPHLWKAFAGMHSVSAPTDLWPQFPGSIGQSGEDGVANYVANPGLGKGSIGYVSAGSALERHLAVASVMNAGGHYVAPTPRSVKAGLAPTKLRSDGTVNLAPGFRSKARGAYSIPVVTYVITRTKDPRPASAKALGTFLSYATCAGQKVTKPLGYAPLSRAWTKADLAGIARIQGASAPPSFHSCRKRQVAEPRLPRRFRAWCRHDRSLAGG